MCKIKATDVYDNRYFYRSKNGETVATRLGLKFRLDGDSYKLVISRAQLSDAGQYGFKAVNSAGSANCSATLNVMRKYHLWYHLNVIYFYYILFMTLLPPPPPPEQYRISWSTRTLLSSFYNISTCSILGTVSK